MGARKGERKLSEMQIRFAKEYAKDFVPLAAAQRAGYADSTARTIAYQNMQHPGIRKLISAEMRKSLSKSLDDLNPEKILREYAAIAFANVTDFITWDEQQTAFVPSKELTKEKTAAIRSIKARTVHVHPTEGSAGRTEITLEVGFWDKLRALEQLARHFQMMKETVVVETPDDPVREMTDEEILDRASSFIAELESGSELREMKRKYNIPRASSQSRD